MGGDTARSLVQMRNMVMILELSAKLMNKRGRNNIKYHETFIVVACNISKLRRTAKGWKCKKSSLRDDLSPADMHS